MDDSAPTQPVPVPVPPGGQVVVSDSEMQHLLDAATASRSMPREWQPPTVEALQQALPQYEISGFIARGGMGAVYKGMQKALKREVAIKVLPPDIDDADMHYAERFKHEAQSMARLSHPNIVGVFDAGETADGLLYFVMEFIEGTDVQQMIAAEGKLEPQHALSIIAHVCDALGFAHEEGIIHRDIKPSNIMVDKRGRVKVADFGLAKAVNVESTMLTSANVAMGTPDFIAPEALISGTQVDQRADLYAVGVMLYVMLTGKIPRGRFQMPTGMVARLDPRYDAIVDKAMQTDRDLRYPSAAAMRADVNRILTESVPVAQLTGAVAVSHWSKAPVLVVAAALVLAAGGWFAWKNTHPVPLDQPATVATYPQPPKWNDAMPSLRSEFLARGLVAAEGEWLKGTTTMKLLRVLSDLPGRNPIVRVRFADRVDLALRWSVTESEDTSYAATIDRESARIVRKANGKTTLALAHKRETFDLAGEHEAAFAAQGDTLSLWLDGQLVATGRDNALSSGKIGIFMQNDDPLGDSRIKKVEYGELPELASALEPRAIKLWDSPDKVPKHNGVRWENGALRLDRSSVQFFGSCSRDVILRADLRYSPDITDSGLSLRAGFGDSLSYYVFAISRGSLKLIVDTSPPSAPATVRKTLKEWPLPASIKADQWVQLEFRIVGDMLTAKLDGEILGTVKDSALAGPGGAVVHSNSTGFFRNIVYVPLDPVPTLEPGTLKLWAAPDGLPKQDNVRWEKGTVVLDHNAILRHTGADSRDAIVRADLRRNPDRSGAGICLRHRVGDVANADDCYRLILNQPAVTLSVVHAGKITEIKSWPLHAPATNDDWVHLELRAVGDTFTVSCDGQQLGSVQDSTLSAPGALALSAAANGWFRYVTYTPLDKPAAATKP